jgi:hypothetical protein
MQERLGVLGGGGQWLNMFAAMKIGGLTDPEILYGAMQAHEFIFNENMLINGDPRNEKSWIRIESDSFLQWIERRSHIEQVELRDMFGQIMRQNVMLLIKIAMVQREMGQLRVELRKSQGDGRAIIMAVQNYFQYRVL